MNNQTTNIFKYLLFFCFINLVTGIFQSEIIIERLNKSMQSIARFTSYISLTLATVLSSLFVLGIFIFVKYLIQLLNVEIKAEVYFKGVKVILMLLIIGGLIKFICSLLFFEDNVNDIILTPNLKNELKENFAVKLGQYIELGTMLIAIIGMYLTLKEENTSKKYRGIICTIFLVLFLGYWSIYLL